MFALLENPAEGLKTPQNIKKITFLRKFSFLFRKFSFYHDFSGFGGFFICLHYRQTQQKLENTAKYQKYRKNHFFSRNFHFFHDFSGFGGFCLCLHYWKTRQNHKNTAKYQKYHFLYVIFNFFRKFSFFHDISAFGGFYICLHYWKTRPKLENTAKITKTSRFSRNFQIFSKIFIFSRFPGVWRILHMFALLENPPEAWKHGRISKISKKITFYTKFSIFFFENFIFSRYFGVWRNLHMFALSENQAEAWKHRKI